MKARPFVARVVTAALAPLGERNARILSGPLRGARMRLDLAREKSFLVGTFEAELQRVLVAESSLDAIAFDVGAYIGFLSLLLARKNRGVVAIEPFPGNAARVRAAAEANRAAIDVVEAAASDHEGEMDFDLGPTDAMGKLAGVEGPASLLEAPDRSIRVRVVTLDAVARERGFPAIVKIDVEGAAGRVLAGATEVLARGPVVVCELHGTAERPEVEATLGSAGYSIEPFGVAWIIGRPA